MQELFLFQPFKKGLFISGILTDKTIGFDLSFIYTPKVNALCLHLQIVNVVFGIGWLF